MGFGVWGVGCGVWGVRCFLFFGVWALGFRGLGLGAGDGMQDLGGWGMGLGVWALGSVVWGLEVWGFELRIGDLS